MTHAARLHRRRFHRRHRPREHAGARRHAHGPDDRRAGRHRWRRTSTRWWSRSSRARSRPRRRWRSRSPRSRWLRQAGCRQFYFKYCSTFDSTAAGNIGPVADALMEALGADFTIACPAFPEQRAHGLPGPSVRRRRAAVGIRHAGPSAHADDATPTSCACCRRRRRRKVGLVALRHAGAAGCRDARAHRGARAEGVGFAVVDALADDDLHRIGEACADLPLVTAAPASRWARREHRRARPARACGHGRDAAARRRHARRALGQLLGRHQRAGRALDAVAAGVPHRSAARSPRGRPVARRGAGLGARRDWRRARCSSTRPPRPTR